MNLRSILIYLTTFFCSYFFLKLSEMINCNKFILANASLCKLHTRKNELNLNKFLAHAFIVIGLFIPSILAALRSPTVGSDNALYVVPNFEIALKNISLETFLKDINGEIEIGFSLLMFVCAKIGNLNCFYFIIEIVPLSIIYYVLTKVSNKVQFSTSFGMLIYYFIFFDFSLSGMRQSIAMSFVLLFWLWLNERKYSLSCLSAFLSITFHKSAFLIVLLIVFIFLISKLKKRIQIDVIITIVLVFFFLFYNKICKFIAPILLYISPRYANYIVKYSGHGFNWSDLLLTDFLSKAIVALVILIGFAISKSKLNSLCRQAIICIILGRYFALFVVNFYEAARIAYYFDLFLLIAIPYAINRSYSKKWSTQFGIKTIMIVPLMLYWLYFIMYIGAYGTQIYKLFNS